MRRPIENPAEAELTILGIETPAGVDKALRRKATGKSAGCFGFRMINGGAKTIKRAAASPEKSVHRTEADRCRDEGRWSEAAALYRKHLAEHQYDFAIWVQAGNCLKEAASYEDALECYWRAI